MNIRELKQILQAMEATGATELSLETAEYKLSVRRGAPELVVTPAAPAPQPQPAAVSAPQPSEAPVAQEETSQPAPEVTQEATDEACAGCVEVKAPIVGTFYRRPAPDAEPYVKEGDRVEKGQVLCIIEAMKLFNEIESEVSGIVRRILVEDGEPVEYGQPLFLIEPV